jgi:hypothetical protein
MATKRKIPLNVINGVAAGNTATIQCPLGYTYHMIGFEYNTGTSGGPTEANCEGELKEWRLKMDGVTQRVCSTAQLFDINRKNGLTPVVGASNGYVPFYFTEKQRQTQIEREATAWGTAGLGSFQIEVDIDSGASSPGITAFAIVDDNSERTPSGIVKWKRETLVVSSTGETTFQLGTNSGDAYQGIYLFEGTADDINLARLEWDGLNIYNLDENFYDLDIASSDFVDVSGLKYISLDNNRPADVLPTIRQRNGQAMKVQEMLLTLDMENANNVTMIRELVGAPY